MTVATESTLEVANDWLTQLKQNSRVVSTAGIAAVVVAAGAWLYTSSQQRKESFAAQELTRARSAAEAGNMPLAASDLTRIVERFRGTRAADQAVIMLGQVRLIQGQAPVAATALEEYVRGRAPNHAKASAYSLLGAALEDQRRFADAGVAYRQASEHAERDFLKAQYLLDATRALALAGDTAGARAAAAEVLQRFGELDQAAEARIRLAEFGGEVPATPGRPSGGN